MVFVTAQMLSQVFHVFCMPCLESLKSVQPSYPISHSTTGILFWTTGSHFPLLFSPASTPSPLSSPVYSSSLMMGLPASIMHDLAQYVRSNWFSQLKGLPCHASICHSFIWPTLKLSSPNSPKILFLGGEDMEDWNVCQLSCNLNISYVYFLLLDIFCLWSF